MVDLNFADCSLVSCTAMDKFVLLQWTQDRGFSWSILPKLSVYTEDLQAGAIVQAKWRSTRHEAKVLAWDGKFTTTF